MRPLEKIADQLWPGAPVVVGMSAGASDSKYTLAAGMPSFGIGEVAIDRDDDRAHGKDERLRTTSFYQAEDFFYQFLKSFTTPLNRDREGVVPQPQTRNRLGNCPGSAKSK